MKATLIIFIVLTLQQSFAQSDMDTSKIIMTRIGWKIGNNSKDSCLYHKLNEYSSGLFREESKLCSEGYTITISKRKIERPFYGQHFKPVFIKDFVEGVVATRRYYYNTSGYLDSLILKEESNGRTLVSKSEKRFDSRNRLEILKNHEGTQQYEYDTEGKLEKTTLIMSNGVKKVDTYRNNKLISESWFNTSNKKYMDQRYSYDSGGNLLRVDLNKYERWNYEYNKYGLVKEEKWAGLDDKKKLVEQINYIYDNAGKLKAAEWFEQGKLKKLIRYYYEQ